MELEPRTSVPAHATGALEFVELSAIAEDATFRLREEGDVAMLAASMGRLGQLVPIELRRLPGAPGQPPPYQVVAGFRRVAALRLLRRDRALARVHRELSDEDAWALALAPPLLTEPIDGAGLEVLRERLAQGTMATWAEELVDEALVRAPVDPELRERFLAFLNAQLAGTDQTSDEVGLDGHAGAEDMPDVVVMDGARGAAADDREAPAGAEDDEAGQSPVEVTPEELTADLSARLYEINQDLALAYESWEDLPRAGRRDILAQARWIADLLTRLDAKG
jgi:ParB family transcriptional regulator, chromosome partitioning protein